MTTALKLRRGTTSQHSSFTGAVGEVTVDTTKKTAVVHDGATAGGTPLATEAALTSGLAGKQAASATLTAIAATGVSMLKNRIINGAMVIDQRNAGASVTASAGNYTLDRWNVYNQTDGAFTVQKVSTAPVGFVNSAKITITSADSSLATSQYSYFRQCIEGYNIADLNWGTANAKTVTLSFWVQSSLTGTFSGSITSGGYTRGYPFTYTISSANTWELKSVTIAGDTGGTWPTDNSSGLQLFFSLGTGATQSGTAGAWGTTQGYVAATGSVNLIGTSGATLYITGVQLEVGASATAFEYRQYGQELALCQRYTYVYSALNQFNNGSGGYARIPIFGSGGTSGIWYPTYPVQMRACPTMTTNNVSSSTCEGYNYSASAPCGAYVSSAMAEGSVWMGQVSITWASGLSSGQIASLRWTPASTANFTFSAEL